MKVIKFFAKGLLAFLLLMLLYFVAALIGSAIPVNKDQPQGGDITIYLRTNGVHTDFIFPVENEVMDWEQHDRFLLYPLKKGKLRVHFFWLGRPGVLSKYTGME